MHEETSFGDISWISFLLLLFLPQPFAVLACGRLGLQIPPASWRWSSALAGLSGWTARDLLALLRFLATVFQRIFATL